MKSWREDEKIKKNVSENNNCFWVRKLAIVRQNYLCCISDVWSVSWVPGLFIGHFVPEAVSLDLRNVVLGKTSYCIHSLPKRYWGRLYTKHWTYTVVMFLCIECLNWNLTILLRFRIQNLSPFSDLSKQHDVFPNTTSKIKTPLQLNIWWAIVKTKICNFLAHWKALWNTVLTLILTAWEFKKPFL
jgi:hypothetical protein